jgi:CNT family concentrative nucleoside transporter
MGGHAEPDRGDVPVPSETTTPSPLPERISVHAPTPQSWRFVLAAAILALFVTAWAFQSWIGPRGQAVCGVVCFIGVAALCSANLRAVSWRTIGWGFALQVLLGLFVIKFEIFGYRPGYALFKAIADAITQFLRFSEEGARFVFGKLADQEAMNTVFPPRDGFIFAVAALPTIIFVSSFFTVLYHFGVLQVIVRVLARAMMYLMGTSGAETLSAAANVFMGQTEAPLIVKPYVPRMTRSELLAMMVGGMATISGGLMAVYISMVGDRADPVAILATSVMAAPCGLYLAKLLLPETEQPLTRGSAPIAVKSTHVNVIDAAAAGASDGLGLALNVAAMLIAFIAFIALVNYVLKLIHPELSLQDIFSRLFWPLAFLIGVEGPDIPCVADLLGIKLVTNEFVAYVKLTNAETGYHLVLGRRSYLLATYALTGFANFASVGIQLGGIGAMAPERRPDLARLGTRALLAGFLATLINASIAGILLDLPEAEKP